VSEAAGQQGPGARSPAPAGSGPAFVGSLRQPHTQSLADVLERVLDKGIVIVGDIQVRLLDIELLTIKVRLMIASVERAREMGINWWEGDPFVSLADSDEAQQGQQALDMQRRIESLERQLGSRPAAPGDVREVQPATEERDQEEQAVHHRDQSS
jgi:hypothetical protein